MRVLAEPELTNEQRLAFDRAVDQFNRGLYFEGHETLEGMWLGLRGPSRDFFQALIQVSVGFLHLERGNHTGAARTFTRALARFESYPAHYFGFDLAAERMRLTTLLTALGGDVAAMPSPPPRWRFEQGEGQPRVRV
jgi:predicted metal-dependent hydrolase